VEREQLEPYLGRAAAMQVEAAEMQLRATEMGAAARAQGEQTQREAVEVRRLRELLGRYADGLLGLTEYIDQRGPLTRRLSSRS
jgi:hypothetical protein